MFDNMQTIENEKGGRQLRDKGNKAEIEQLAVQRQLRQQELIARRIEEAKKRLQGSAKDVQSVPGSKAEEIKIYRSPMDYPKTVVPHQLSNTRLPEPWRSQGPRPTRPPAPPPPPFCWQRH